MQTFICVFIVCILSGTYILLRRDEIRNKQGEDLSTLTFEDLMNEINQIKKP